MKFKKVNTAIKIIGFSKDLKHFMVNCDIAEYLLEHKLYRVIKESIHRRVDYHNTHSRSVEHLMDDYLLRGSKSHSLFKK